MGAGKTKPLHLLQSCYDVGHRHFGENYVQEVVEKAPQMPADTRWHFIGPLQSNKVNKLVKSSWPSLYMVETVASVKIANKLNKVVGELIAEGGGNIISSSSEGKVAGHGAAARTAPLKVMVQVNTSGEDTKSGLTPGDAVVELARLVDGDDCAALELCGLMTIGRYGDTTTECFESLVECRDLVADALGRDPQTLELSMGMSGDFESAIGLGSTNVRVGSTIFGSRYYSNKK